MFVLYPVTITDPYTQEKMSVWAAKQEFFDFFVLEIEDMSIGWISRSKWSLSIHPETKGGYRLLRRGPKWSEFFGTPEGMVQSDDDFFIDEILAGLDIQVDVEISQQDEERDILEIIIHPILYQ